MGYVLFLFYQHLSLIWTKISNDYEVTQLENSLSKLYNIYQILKCCFPKKEYITKLSNLLMKFQRFSIEKTQIEEALKLNNSKKVSDLCQLSETLQLQIPNIFTTTHPPNIKIEEDTVNKTYQFNMSSSHIVWPKSKRNAITIKSYEHLSKKNEIKNTYYSLIQMLFPQVGGIPPLTIDIIDSIFFNNDSSMTYIYTDPRRGLIKVRAKNYTDLFFKRKAELNQGQHHNYSKLSKRISCNYMSFNKKKGDSDLNLEIYKNIDYVALVRYKDESFIRLKQHQFKSIFVRPVQALQKYKMANNTQYIQMIPEQVNFQEDTILTIPFVLEKYKNTEYFKKVTEKHLQQTSFIYNDESLIIKRQIKKTSVEAYLLYIVFQIFAYLNIHYHKQINYGVFQFMKVGNRYYLSNVQKIKFNESQTIKRQYVRQNLFEQATESKSHSTHFQGKEEKSGVMAALNEMFDNENHRICKKMKNFVQQKIDAVKNKEDVSQSNRVFQSINQKCKHNLHELFENEKEYYKFLKKKENELDGFSPLTSISNISRKKQNKVITEQTENDYSMQQQNKSGKIRQLQVNSVKLKKRKQSLHMRTAQSRWFKKIVNGKIQCYVPIKKQSRLVSCTFQN